MYRKQCLRKCQKKGFAGGERRPLPSWQFRAAKWDHAPPSLECPYYRCSLTRERA